VNGTGTLGAMKTRDIRDLVRFTDDGARAEVLYETEQLWSQVVCLQGAQDHGPVVDERADGIAAVLSGEVAAQIGSGRARMKQWEAVVVPSGEALTLRNASPEPAVVLLVLAPPPQER
jgi:mannose-6-phosphate isomerase-like protein (cupin superfamily)